MSLWSTVYPEKKTFPQGTQRCPDPIIKVLEERTLRFERLICELQKEVDALNEAVKVLQIQTSSLEGKIGIKDRRSGDRRS